MATEIHAQQTYKVLGRGSQADLVYRNDMWFWESVGVGMVSKVQKIIDVAIKICPSVCSTEDKEGFMIAITNEAPGFPILVIQIGEINTPDEDYPIKGKTNKYTEYAWLKITAIKKNPGMICSNENLSLNQDQRTKSWTGNDIPGGAILFPDGTTISTSAFKNAQMDTAVSLSLGAGANLIKSEEAYKIASDSRLNCKDEFDKILQVSQLF